MREFLHVDDLAQAVIFALEKVLTDSLYNVGFGEDITIMDLAKKIKSYIEYEGQIFWDKTKPDGTPKKLMNSFKLNNMGWLPKIDIEDGVKSTYEWFKRTI